MSMDQTWKNWPKITHDGIIFILTLAMAGIPVLGKSKQVSERYIKFLYLWLCRDFLAGVNRSVLIVSSFV